MLHSIAKLLKKSKLFLKTPRIQFDINKTKSNTQTIDTCKIAYLCTAVHT